MSALLHILRPAVEGALRAAAPAAIAPNLDPAVLAGQVIDRVEQDPALAHLANAEPWYRSRVTLGALVSAVTPLLALAIGHEITADEQASLLAALTVAGTLFGAAVTLYGRWAAKRPLGR